MSTTTASRTMMMTDAIRDALDVALGLDPEVFELGEDIQDPKGGGFGVHKGLEAKYGSDRVRCTPISEQAIMGAAIGAAMAGMRPVAEIMLMNFISVAADQLFNHAAKLRYMSGGATPIPLTVRTTTGGCGLRRPAFRDAGGSTHPHTRLEGGGPVNRGRRQGSPAVSDLRR